METKSYRRIYETILANHIGKYRQMVLLSGPRQVGKTTLGETLSGICLNWDDDDVKRTIMSGQSETVKRYGLAGMSETDKVVVFDEIHKYARWKQFLKGFYDVYGRNVRIVATGSAKMDVYKKGGDSMMGRYFPYRMHPFSVAELMDVTIPGDGLIRRPRELAKDEWDALVRFGGFPDPFVKRDARFSRRWQSLRFEQLTRIDVRDLTRVAELDQLAALARILSLRSGEQLVYKNLGNEVGVDEKTAKKWVKTLKGLYFGFEVRPWFRNVENSIRKTPKWFVRDWSMVEDVGKRAETMVACHLLKAVECWTDLGFGEFSLNYLRNKRKQEVDFIVARDNVPWFLVEVKNADETLSDALALYQGQTGAKHALQVVLESEYVNRSCFDYTTPVVVPAKTFLSQLV